MAYAAYKQRRHSKHPEERDNKNGSQKPPREEQENGIIIFSGGNSTNIVIRDWLDQKQLKQN